MKIALDENLPPAMARVFEVFAKEKSLQRLAKGLTVCSARDYAPKIGDADYVAKSDVPWVQRFSGDGGRIIISGDTRMKRIPHERLALVEAGMIVFFVSEKWNSWQFCRKCSLLIHWWPAIVTTAKNAKPSEFYRIPANWADKQKIEKIANEDLKLLKIERQKSKRGVVRAGRQRQNPHGGAISPDLFAQAEQRTDPDQRQR